MASIPLNIHFVKENVVRTLKFPIHTTISEILVIIGSKYNERGEMFGLFQSSTPNSKPRWLENDKTLIYYDIMSGTTVQYKKRIRNIRIRLPNNTSVKVKVDGSLKIVDLMRPICQKLELPNSFDFSLQKRIDENMVEWLNPLQSLDEQGVSKKDILFIKKRFFSTVDKKIDKSNELKFQLLYDLCFRSVINSEFPCNQNEAIELAALSLQASYGDYINFTNGIKKDSILKHLPKRCLKQKNVEKNIINAYKELHGLKIFEAKRRYIQLCKRNEYYGFTFFKANTKNGKKTRDVLIGLNSTQIIIIDFIGFEVIRSHSIHDIKQYYANVDKLSLSVKDHEDISLNSKVSPIIAYMIGVYIDMTLKNKKEIFPIGKVDEALFNEMLNKVIPELYEDSNEEFRYRIPILKEKELYDQAIVFINIIMSHMKVLADEYSPLENELLDESMHRMQMISSKYELDKCINQIDGIIKNDNCTSLDSTVYSLLETVSNLNSSITYAIYKKYPRANIFFESVTPINKVLIRLLRYMALLSTKYQKTLSNKALNIIKKYKQLSNDFKSTQTSHMASNNLENLLVYVIHLMNVSIVNFEKELNDINNAKLESLKVMEEIKSIMENIMNRMVSSRQFIITDRLLEDLNDYNLEMKKKLSIISEQFEEGTTGSQEYQNFSLYSSELEYLLSIVRIQNVTGHSEDILEAAINLEMMILRFINSPKDMRSLKSLINAVNTFVSLTDNTMPLSRTTKKLFRHSKDSIISSADKLKRDENLSEDLSSRCFYSLIYHIRHLVTCMGIVPSVKIFREYTFLAILNVHKLLILMKERISSIKDMELKERIFLEENHLGVNILKILKAIDQKEEVIDVDYVLTIQDFKDFQSMLNRFNSFILSYRPYFENYDLMLLNDLSANLNHSVRLMEKASQILQNTISLNETLKAIEATSMARKKLEASLEIEPEYKEKVNDKFESILSNSLSRSLRMINCIKDFEKCQIIPIFLVSDSINDMKDIILQYASNHLTKGKIALTLSILAFEHFQKALEATINIHSLQSYSKCIEATISKLISFIQSLHSLGRLIKPKKYSGRLLSNYYTNFSSVYSFLLQCTDHIIYEPHESIIQDLEFQSEALENLHLAHQNNEDYMISNVSTNMMHILLSFLSKVTQLPPDNDLTELSNSLCTNLFDIFEKVSSETNIPIQDDIKYYDAKLNMIHSKLLFTNKPKETRRQQLHFISKIIQNLKHPDYRSSIDTSNMNTTSYYCSKILSNLKLGSTSALSNDLISSMKDISTIALNRINSTPNFRLINELKLIFKTLTSIYGNHQNELKFKLQIIKEYSKELISHYSKSIGNNYGIFKIKLNEYELSLSKLETAIKDTINYMMTHNYLLYSNQLTLEREIREQQLREKELLSLYKNLHLVAQNAEKCFFKWVSLAAPEYIQCNLFLEKSLHICKLVLNLLAKLGTTDMKDIQLSIQNEIENLLFIEESIVLKNPSYNIINLNPIISCISEIDCAMEIGKVIIGNFYIQLRDTIDNWIEELIGNSDFIKDKVNNSASKFTTAIINFALSQLSGRDEIFKFGKAVLEGCLKIFDNPDDFHSSRNRIIESLRDLKNYIIDTRTNLKEWIIEKLEELKSNCKVYPSSFSTELSKDSDAYESISAYGEKLIDVSTKLIEDLANDVESKHSAELAIYYAKSIFDYIKSITSESRWEEISGHYKEAIDYFILSINEKEYLKAMSVSTKQLMTVCKELVEMNKEMIDKSEEEVSEVKTKDTPNNSSIQKNSSIQQVPDIIEPNHLISDTIMEYAKDIALAVTNLVNASLDLQKEIGVENPKSSGKYHDDPSWEKGFLSTGLGVAASISLLIKYANAAYRGENDVHHLVAAAKSVYTATSHLVVVSRVKAPYESPSMEKLDQISKYISDVTSKLVEHVKTLNNGSNESSTHSASVDKPKLSQRVHNLEKQVRINKLEKKLEEARNNLLKWRKNRYKSLIVETDKY